MKTLAPGGLLGLAALCLAPAALAGQTCFRLDAPTVPTDWSTTIQVPQHDPALGVLTGFELKLFAIARADLQVENTDLVPSTVMSQYAVQMTLMRPDLSPLLVAQPGEQFVDQLAPFDGVLDFLGPSAANHLGESALATSTFNTPGASDLALFTGNGTLALPLSALGSIQFASPSDLAAVAQLRAGAMITICYEWEPAGGGEGCSPGYWKNHLSSWGPTGFAPDDDFDTVFGADAFTPDRTLYEALRSGGGNIDKLGRMATAALLNASHPDLDFPLTQAQVIQLVHDAIVAGQPEPLASELDVLVNLGCPLN